MICHALIAARGGSKGLKNKNLKKLKRLSLVEIAIKNALSSGVFSEIFCSSDSKKILKLTKKKQPIFLGQTNIQMTMPHPKVL